MSIEIVDVDNIDYDFCGGLYGYHLYQKMWKPIMGQVITFGLEKKILMIDLLFLVQPRYLEK